MLDRQIITFNENITGLREFIILIGPFIEEHHKKAVAEHYKIREGFELAEKLAVETDEAQKLILEEQIKYCFDGELIQAIKIDKENADNNSESDDLDREIPKYVIRVPVSLNPNIEQAIKAPKKTTYQKELLYINAFIGLLSSVEWFYSQVLHFYYDRHPEAAGIKKKTMTLEELKSFNTVNDAEKYLIDNKIEEIFRGGFEGWISILKEEVKLKMPYIKPFFDELLEVYQRRNLLVHNGGIINSIYLYKVPENLRENLKIGDKLSITSEYLENAIRKLHIVFTLIAAELWKKLEPEEENRADILNSIAYKNILQFRWEVGEWLNDFIKNDESLKSRVKTLGQLNYWLCKKRLGDKSFKSEISKADFTDKSLRYQLAICALKDDVKDFFDLLPETIRTKSLDVNELLEFPIFEEMRETKEFQDFKMNSKEFKEYRNIEEDINENDDETIDDIIDDIIKESTSQ